MTDRVTSAFCCLFMLLASANVAGTPGVVSNEETSAAPPNAVEISVSELIAAAENGDPKALVRLGDYYIYGQEDTPYDENLAKEGLRCYLRAAIQGLAHGQFCLGYHYWQGIGVKWNPYEAVKWFEKAADQGHPIAQCELSLAYGGLGARKNPKKAHEIRKKSVEQGWRKCQTFVGVDLWNGRGVRKDKKEACMWFLISDDELDQDWIDKCRAKLAPEEFAEAEMKASQWETIHPKGSHEYFKCWIPQTPTYFDVPDSSVDRYICSEGIDEVVGKYLESSERPLGDLEY